jgi:hypothetical protein
VTSQALRAIRQVISMRDQQKYWKRKNMFVIALSQKADNQLPGQKF